MSRSTRCCAPAGHWHQSDPGLANLKNQQRSGLRDHRFGPSYLVYPVLNALGIKSPTGRYGNVLLAIDFKGRGNTDHAGGCREAPKLIPRARIERPEFPVRGSAREYDVSACHQERRPLSFPWVVTTLITSVPKYDMAGDSPVAVELQSAHGQSFFSLPNSRGWGSAQY
jgi:hypothetical protein